MIATVETLLGEENTIFTKQSTRSSSTKANLILPFSHQPTPMKALEEITDISIISTSYHCTRE